MKRLSIILPTLNEYENLKFLIPQFEKMLSNNVEIYEIIVVDDGSTDKTFELMNNLMHENKKIKFILRETEPSLPMSIWDGIKNSLYENVMWLDADGSMHTDAVEILIVNYFKDNITTIGSRFKEGGGYKGINDLNSKSIFKAILNVRKSEDSVLGMIMSVLFNKILNMIFNSNVKDLTSGFVIINKNYLSKTLFQDSNYGEYFIKLISNLIKLQIQINEIGYVCDTRKYGKSKTASSFLQLITRGIPYITMAYKCRKELKI